MSGRSKSTTMNEPSFSSILLEEIYRSIDEPAAADQNPKFHERKQGRMNRSCTNDTEEMRRIEKWMEKGYNCTKDKFSDSENVNDLLFSSSSSSSSGSSSGGVSSSDSEYFGGSQPPTAVSCFSRLKPIKTGGIRTTLQEKTNKNEDSARSRNNYADLKKAKQQPSSPGGRLTSFINSLFTNSTKSKNLQDRRTLKSSTAGKQRTDRTVDYDHQQSSSVNEFQDYGKLKWNLIRDRNGEVYLDQRNHHAAAEVMTAAAEETVLRSCGRIPEDEDDDCLSDSSSDLFELNHLFFGNNRFCEELPLYETTHFDSVRALIS